MMYCLLFVKTCGYHVMNRAKPVIANLLSHIYSYYMRNLFHYFQCNLNIVAFCPLCIYSILSIFSSPLRLLLVWAPGALPGCYYYYYTRFMLISHLTSGLPSSGFVVRHALKPLSPSLCYQGGPLPRTALSVCTGYVMSIPSV